MIGEKVMLATLAPGTLFRRDDGLFVVLGFANLATRNRWICATWNGHSTDAPIDQFVQPIDLKRLLAEHAELCQIAHDAAEDHASLIEGYVRRERGAILDLITNGDWQNSAGHDTANLISLVAARGPAFSPLAPDQLRAENERLWQALAQIANDDHDAPVYDHREIAREVLGYSIS